MFKKIGLLLLLLNVAVLCRATGEASYETLQVKPVAENDGDTINTYKVTLDTFTPKAIDAGNVLNATTNVSTPSIRRRTIMNPNAFRVYIGSAAALGSTWSGFGFIIGEASTTYNSYTTWNTGPIYGTCLAGNTSCSVYLIKETNSIP